ncbi:MAG: hypothetical protein Q8K55_14850 [Gemmatimonadaceae bacterium]|nr:hypothetical protein [Gemmatimonadaceae bacterium]
MTTTHVIPAYPFEGALFWFLSNGQPHSIHHSYYKLLYGPDPQALASRAAAIVALYPEIRIAGADAGVPDYDPTIRLGMDRSDSEWSPENIAVATAALSEPATRAFLNGHAVLANNDELQRHFLCRTSLQIRLAAKSSATLVGSSFFHRAYTHVAPWIRELLGETTTSDAPHSRIAIEQSTLSIVGLEFAPASVDAFAAIRASKEIAAYAEGFRGAIEEAATDEHLETRLLALMAEAMDSSDVAEHASRGFQTAGSLMTAVGFIPLVGNAASVLGAGTDVAGRAAAAIAKRKEWFLLGAKLQDIAIRETLARHKKDLSNS